MFSNDSDSADNNSTNVTTSIVSEGATIEGILEFSSVDLRIEGTVHGDITTDGRVVVSKGAEVQGTINARTIQIAGGVEGHIQAQEELVLCPPSEVHATLEAEVLEIQPGADFSGEVPDQKDVDLKEKEEVPSESDVDIPDFVPESAHPELDTENGEVEVAA
jgi:cytoskeletal protein CcmA (bactofilin family)